MIAIETETTKEMKVKDTPGLYLTHGLMAIKK